MAEIFLTADTHFYHKNILKYCDRSPYETIEEMNEGLIERWNSKIGPKDTVYHLGDIGFCSVSKLDNILNRLNGNKCLIRGNHDGSKMTKKLPHHFAWIKSYYELSLKEERYAHPETGEPRRLILSHFPMSSWHQMGHHSIMCHGHSHGSLADPNDYVYSENESTRNMVQHLNVLADRAGLPQYMVPLKRLDVGVDCNNMYPWNVDEILKKMDKVEFHSIDHHNEKGSDT